MRWNKKVTDQHGGLKHYLDTIDKIKIRIDEIAKRMMIYQKRKKHL